MTSDPDDKYVRYQQQRTNAMPGDHSSNEKKDNNDISYRRHSLAHVNFRKAIYRSLSLTQGTHENNNIQTKLIEYFIKFCFICLFIVLIGSLIKLMCS
ncbi:unnamed protein product [Rotaria socialis]|uniref:Uncharacterized protein n=1 Tax=Rotaria socialis TaxID=392032 RepID=A0A820IZF3_9BILA|nr:unnamed protein product [Rotaria socialis]CAF3495402.1 unnamed protein product [Rotaria socialis]CAF3553567.1 unnamed protein product [Rotaria socialis]CAF4315621.1 unnamed protein product [Rotaria socialis]CAF4393951.1 unnamed protein product [Rotaria socialis]